MTIFVSYRRDDSQSATRQLVDQLTQAFGPEEVFRDTRSIKAGERWQETINENLERCTVLIVMIGPRWLDAKLPDGRRRLEDPDDELRHEIATVLKRSVPVVPVLIEGATLPSRDDLPEGLKRLADWQAYSMTDAHWNQDVADLVARLASIAALKVRRPEDRSAGSLEMRRRIYEDFNETLNEKPPEERAKIRESFTRNWLASRDMTVRDLKVRLSSVGFYRGDLDDVFEPALGDAIIAFQQKQGLTPVDGICGEMCLGKLDELQKVGKGGR